MVMKTTLTMIEAEKVEGTAKEAVQSFSKRLAVHDAGVPGVVETPSVGGSPQYMVGLDGGGANGLMGFRATVGAGDDTVASTRLSSGGPNVTTSSNDGVLNISATTPFSRLDVVGVKNGTAGGNCVNKTSTAGVADTAANALAQMTTFTFSTPVRRVTVALNTDGTGQYGELTVEGSNYA